MYPSPRPSSVILLTSYTALVQYQNQKAGTIHKAYPDCTSYTYTCVHVNTHARACAHAHKHARSLV